MYDFGVNTGCELACPRTGEAQATVATSFKKSSKESFGTITFSDVLIELGCLKKKSRDY